ncbi:MAG: FAD-binding oxidoreductase [Oscillospiraceae bacterium]|nr:MAG: FAD-binding oxidoreductase [Oscillospiraceae bacterium]
MQTADVVVIGGGIIGCSIAYHLKKKGAGRVVLVERRGIGEETSSACDGGVNLQTKAPGPALRLAKRSLQLYEGLAEELDYEIHFERCGGMVMADSPELIGLLEQSAAEQAAAGVEVTILNGQEARRLEPVLSQQVAAVTYCPGDGRVNPIRTTIGYARAAGRLGAEILTNTAVTGIRTKHNEVIGVETSRGMIQTGTVINACGVYAPEIGRMVGLDLPIRPRKGNIIVTEQVAPCLAHNLICARYIALKHNPDLVRTSQDPSMRLGVNLFLEQTHEGNLIFGSNREWAGFDKSTSYEILCAICRYAVRFAPFLAQMRVIRSFAGLRPYCEGGPILGPVDGIQGFVMAAGHEGDGIAMAPITGEILSDFVMSGTVSEEIRPFLFSRFAPRQPQGSSDGREG